MQDARWMVMFDRVMNWMVTIAALTIVLVGFESQMPAIAPAFVGVSNEQATHVAAQLAVLIMRQCFIWVIAAHLVWNFMAMIFIWVGTRVQVQIDRLKARVSDAH